MGGAGVRFRVAADFGRAVGFSMLESVDTKFAGCLVELAKILVYFLQFSEHCSETGKPANFGGLCNLL